MGVGWGWHPPGADAWGSSQPPTQRLPRSASFYSGAGRRALLLSSILNSPRLQALGMETELQKNTQFSVLLNLWTQIHSPSRNLIRYGSLKIYFFRELCKARRQGKLTRKQHGRGVSGEGRLQGPPLPQGCWAGATGGWGAGGGCGGQKEVPQETAGTAARPG